MTDLKDDFLNFGVLIFSEIRMAQHLSELKKGMGGIIAEITHPELEVALMKVGLVRGDRFVLSNIAPLGGPLALLINGHKVALRRRDAQFITVNPLP